MSGKFSRFISTAGRKAKHAAPTIMVAVGCVGVVCATVKGCKDTPKALARSAEHDANIEKINKYADAVANGDILDPDYDSVKDRENDIRIEKVHKGVDIVKTYMPTIAIEAVSLGLIIAGFGTMKNRAANAVAALAATDIAYRTLDAKMRNAIGDDKADMLVADLYQEKVKRQEEGEDGKMKTVTTKELFFDIPEELADELEQFNTGASPYMRLLCGSNCDIWDNNELYRDSIMKQAHEDLNRKLRQEGVVFLNDVAEYFRIPKTQAGQFVGWKWTGEQDDFKINLRPKKINTRSPYLDDNDNHIIEPAILIDPNVDGVVVDSLF